MLYGIHFTDSSIFLSFYGDTNKIRFNDTTLLLIEDNDTLEQICLLPSPEKVTVPWGGGNMQTLLSLLKKKLN